MSGNIGKIVLYLLQGILLDWQLIKMNFICLEVVPLIDILEIHMFLVILLQVGENIKASILHQELR